MRTFDFFVSGCIICLLSSCASTANIYSLCEKDKQGDYIVKWEVSPDPQEGQVEIYSSTDDKSLTKNKKPSLVTNVENRVATLPNFKNNTRQFFQLKANNSFSGIVSNRKIDFDVIQNFRDLGGYYNNENKQLCWDKVYRSGNLFALTPNDLFKLKKMGIKTIIDLRNEKESLAFPDGFLGFSHYQIPIDTLNTFEVQKRIAAGTFLKGDALLYMQDAYLYILKEKTKELKEIFDLLLKEKNYPILIHDNLGKDRTGIISYLILKAVGVSDQDAMNDYLLSNDYIDLSEFQKIMKEMPEAIQESMTVIVRANEDYMDYALDEVAKEYGSLDSYFSKALGLNDKKIKKLKSIMLY